MSLPFKSYLSKKAAYKGGKSRLEVQMGGREIHKMSSNENPIGASPKAKAAILKHVNALSEYPDRTDLRLQKALEKYYNNELNSKQFFATNSGTGIIELIVKGFMDEHSECIYSSPGFGAYKSFPTKVGAKSIDVPLIGNNFQLDVKGILDAITKNTKLIFVTSPNNPTGTCPPKSQMDELVDGLPNDVILVYDEVYFQYVQLADYVRALHYVKSGKNVIGLNSFSKAYGLAGLRVGYAYSTPEIAEYLHNICRPFLLDSLSLEATIAALEDDAFIEQTVNLIHKEKEYLYRELNLLTCKYWKTQANFLLIDPKVNEVVIEKLMLKEGIMVRPAGKFGVDGIRVTIGQHHQNVAFIKALKKIILK